jgi:diguanylate cyclase (GGDEF)-like protein
MQLTEFVKHLDIANLGDRVFVLKDPGRHELHFLADTVNITAQKLHRSIEQNLQLYHALKDEQLALKALNETLEQRVAQRTEQLQELNQKLAELSITDGLTAIGNRRRFDDVLASEWNRAERLGQPLSIALLDVDWFKKYNDHQGHLAGDECLRRIARVLADHARRAGDLAARYGGEEFAIIMPAGDSATALTLAQAICEAIHQLGIAHPLSEFDCVTVSIGVATMQPDKNLAPNALINLADQALYRAKSEGRNCVVSV